MAGNSLIFCVESGIHVAFMIEIWTGDITKLAVDAIVNAANERLLARIFHQFAEFRLRDFVPDSCSRPKA